MYFYPVMVGTEKAGWVWNVLEIRISFILDGHRLGEIKMLPLLYDGHDFNNTERKHTWLEDHRCWTGCGRAGIFWSRIVNIHAPGPGLSMEMHQLRGKRGRRDGGE